MKNFQIALVVVVATMATGLAVPLSEPVPVNSTLMKTMGTIDVDGVGPIHIVSHSTGNVRVNVDCYFFKLIFTTVYTPHKSLGF